jgi:hypothetical protein
MPSKAARMCVTTLRVGLDRPGQVANDSQDHGCFARQREHRQHRAPPLRLPRPAGHHPPHRISMSSRWLRGKPPERKKSGGNPWQISGLSGRRYAMCWCPAGWQLWVVVPTDASPTRATTLAKRFAFNTTGPLWAVLRPAPVCVARSQLRHGGAPQRVG